MLGVSKIPKQNDSTQRAYPGLVTRSAIVSFVFEPGEQSSLTDSTIAPPKQPAILFNERFMGARHEKGCYEISSSHIFHACKGLSNDDVGAARGNVFQKIRPGSGGATAERLCCRCGPSDSTKTTEQTWVTKSLARRRPSCSPYLTSLSPEECPFLTRF